MKTQFATASFVLATPQARVQALETFNANSPVAASDANPSAMRFPAIGAMVRKIRRGGGDGGPIGIGLDGTVVPFPA